MASYIDNNLISSEEVIYRAKVSWMSVVLPLILGVFLIPFYGLGLLIIIPIILSMISTELALTNKRIISKFGFISRNTVEIRLEKVEGIVVNQGVFGRIFNFGNVVIKGTGGSNAPIPRIADPLTFRRQFNTYMEEYSNNSSK